MNSLLWLDTSGHKLNAVIVFITYGVPWSVSFRPHPSKFHNSLIAFNPPACLRVCTEYVQPKTITLHLVWSLPRPTFLVMVVMAVVVVGALP